MPYITDPFKEPQAYDNVEIGRVEYGGSAELGKVEVNGFKRPFGWDIKKGKGVKGATLTLNEYPPSEGTITFFMWTSDHFVRVEEILEAFDYDPVKKKSNPQDIYNPELASRSINSVVCKDIGDLVNAGKGLYKRTISCIEYLPPPKKDASKTANGSGYKQGFAKGKTDDPIADAQQEQIARLLAEAKGEPYPKPKGT